MRNARRRFAEKKIERTTTNARRLRVINSEQSCRMGKGMGMGDFGKSEFLGIIHGNDHGFGNGAITLERSHAFKCKFCNHLQPKVIEVEAQSLM